MNDAAVLVQTLSGFCKVTDHVSLAKGNGSLFLYQTAPQMLSIEMSNNRILFNRPQKIKSFVVGQDSFMLWDGKTAEIFGFDNGEFKCRGALQCSQNLMGISEYYACAAQENSVIFHNIKNGTNASIRLSSTGGYVLEICVSNNKIHVFTSEFILNTFECTGRESKLISTLKLCNEFHDSAQTFKMKSNYDGTAVAILGSNDSSLIKVIYLEMGSKASHYNCGSVINAFEWDCHDSRFLVVNIKSGDSSREAKNQIITLFFVPGHLLFKEIQNAPSEAELLVSVQIPTISFSKKIDFNSSMSSKFLKLKLKEYEGIDTADQQLLQTITTFSFHLTMGDIENAVRLVNLLKNDNVWINLAQLCVKMGRMKLGKFCLGKLRNAKALRSINHYSNSANQTTLVAQYAIHLGLYEDAKELWHETKNYAELNKFYQNSGQWEHALETAATKDRPSLSLTYYKFALHLQEHGDKHGAIVAFEKSNSSKSEIPRMMLGLGNEIELKTYVETSIEKSVKKWWAQNAESHGDIGSAMKHYEEIGDIFSIVRVHCLSGNFQKAKEMADIYPGNLAVQLVIARHCESIKKWDDALSYYSRSKCFGNAIRIAKEHHIEKELMQLAFQSTAAHMSEVAKYFEKKGHFDRAITLYSKSGNFRKALHLCFNTDNINQIETIGTNC
jgi:intraflagellar transport protein 140